MTKSDEFLKWELGFQNMVENIIRRRSLARSHSFCSLDSTAACINANDCLKEDRGMTTRKFTTLATSVWSALRRTVAKVRCAVSPARATPVTSETNNSGARGSSNSGGGVMVECSYTIGLKKSLDGGETWRTVMTPEELQSRIKLGGSF